MTLSADIQSYINNAASQFNNVDPSFLSAVAQLESGGNASAQSNLSSAGGLFQFTSGTAAQYGLQNVFDPQASANAAAALASNNYNSLSARLGTAPSGWQQYLAWQQGAGGAGALLTADPSLPAVTALQNAGISSSRAYQSIVNNVGSDYSGNKATMSTGDFLSYWQSKFNGVASGTSAGGGTGAVSLFGGGSGSGSGAGSATASADVPSVTGIKTVDSVIGWLASMATRVSVFAIGIVFVAGGLFLFGGNSTVKAVVAKAEGKA